MQQALKLGKKGDELANGLDLGARTEWRERNTQGKGDIYQQLQPLGERTIDKSFLKTKIEYYVLFDVRVNEDGTKIKECCWCRGEVKAISDGTWLKPNARTSCYDKAGAVKMLWDPVVECDLPASEGVQVLDPKLWNKAVKGTWRKLLKKEMFGP